MKQKIISLDNFKIFKKNILNKIKNTPKSIASFDNLQNYFTFDENSVLYFCDEQISNYNKIELPYTAYDYQNSKYTLFEWNNELYVCCYGDPNHPYGNSSFYYYSINPWEYARFSFPGYETKNAMYWITRDEIINSELYNSPMLVDRPIWTSEFAGYDDGFHFKKYYVINKGSVNIYPGTAIALNVFKLF